MKWIFNASYCPDFNPIEGVIGLAKNKIKKVRLHSFVNAAEIDLNDLILKSFYEIKKKTIRNLIEKSRK